MGLKKMVSRKNIFVCVLFLFSVCAFCQETAGADGGVQAEKKRGLVHPYVQIGSQLTVNTAPKEISAPSPLRFLIGGGAVFDFSRLISLEPRLDFWTMYYLYDGENALPAEIEQRTATVLCFMLDVPVGFHFYAGKNIFTVGCGIGFLSRVAFLSTGVKKDEEGATGTAEGDVQEIVRWFWSGARFLYPEVFTSWEYQISDSLKAGIFLKAYFCVGSLIDDRGADGMLVSMGARFSF